jgi:hypothetical protein
MELLMKKLTLSVVLLAGVLLSACASKSTPTSQPASAVPPTPTLQATLAGPAPTAVLEVPQSSDLTGPDSGCTVIARQPTPGPTQESLFPGLSEADHVKGSETAGVTIIEYSDFQ